MFSNLTKEIIYYSLIPVAILTLICLVLLIIRKKENNAFKYNYIIKILLMLIDGIVLSLIIGYSVWATARFIRNGTLSANIIYVIIFVVLIFALAILLLFTCMKLYNNLSNKYLEEKETN